DGVHLTGGGSVTNGNSAAPAQIIASNNAIEIDGGAGRVANYGTIAATGTAGIGVLLKAGGLVANAAGAIITGGSAGVGIGQPTGGEVIFGSIAATCLPCIR